jgi:hypothetical protein
MKVGEGYGGLEAFQDLMGEERGYYREVYEENDPRKLNGTFQRGEPGTLDERKSAAGSEAKLRINPIVEKQLDIARAFQKTLCEKALSPEPFLADAPGRGLASDSLEGLRSLQGETDEILKNLDSYRKALDRSNADLLEWVLAVPGSVAEADAGTWQDLENNIDWLYQCGVWLLRAGAVLGYFVLTVEARPFLLGVQAASGMLDVPMSALKGATAILLSAPAVNGIAVDLLVLEAFWHDRVFGQETGRSAVRGE